jgi:Icc-related predicted phosphoesterase
MRIAIFADIHGKILLPFKLVDLYQKKTRKSVDLILQCGDIGAFPDLNNLDKATIRHAKNDRDELGFHDNFRIENTRIRAFLEKLNLDMICVRGNHEDHDFLNDLEAQYISESRFPIDIYNRVWLCKSAEIQTFTKGEESFTFVGIGRIGDRKGRTHQQFIQAYEQEKIQKLLKSKIDFDLLITHDKDDSSQRGYGSTEIRKVLDNLIFQYHFYGHTGEPFHTELDDNQITINCKIKELEFDTTGILPIGSMIILEKKEHGNWEMDVVEQRLTNQLQKWNWKI